MASTVISLGTARNSSSKEPTMTVGNSARFTTSCRVFACSSATSPVASSARAACSRMDASRSASLGTDERPAQHVHQRVGVGHLVRAGRQEAVPPREVARDEPCELHGDHLVAEQCQKPTNRAAELLAAAAPALRLGPGHGAHHVGQQPGRSPGTSARGRAHHGVHVFRAALVAPLQGVHVHALAAREAGGRLGGVAVRVERDLGGRPAERLLRRPPSARARRARP